MNYIDEYIINTFEEMNENYLDYRYFHHNVYSSFNEKLINDFELFIKEIREYENKINPNRKTHFCIELEKESFIIKTTIFLFQAGKINVKCEMAKYRGTLRDIDNAGVFRNILSIENVTSLKDIIKKTITHLNEFIASYEERTHPCEITSRLLKDLCLPQNALSDYIALECSDIKIYPSRQKPFWYKDTFFLLMKTPLYSFFIQSKGIINISNHVNDEYFSSITTSMQYAIEELKQKLGKSYVETDKIENELQRDFYVKKKPTFSVHLHENGLNYDFRFSNLLSSSSLSNMVSNMDLREIISYLNYELNQIISGKVDVVKKYKK